MGLGAGGFYNSMGFCPNASLWRLDPAQWKEWGRLRVGRQSAQYPMGWVRKLRLMDVKTHPGTRGTSVLSLVRSVWVNHLTLGALVLGCVQ